tara:strand:+ start:7024 stop:7254 length:231 start_codon:yes stop_codon:yes gene_type:complete
MYPHNSNNAIVAKTIPMRVRMETSPVVFPEGGVDAAANGASLVAAGSMVGAGIDFTPLVAKMLSNCAFRSAAIYGS